MVDCAVASCKNWFKTGSTITYHTFPSDSTTKLAWKTFCKRGDKFNLENAIICSKHFVEDDYEENKMNDILGIPYKKKLRRTAVPKLNFSDDCGQQTEVLPISHDTSSVDAVQEFLDINADNSLNAPSTSITRAERAKSREARKTRESALQHLQKLSPIKKKHDQETYTEDVELENLCRIVTLQHARMTFQCIIPMHYISILGFHGNTLSRTKQVVKGLCAIIQEKFPNIHADIIKKYVRMRMFIRLCNLNEQLKQQANERSRKRKSRQWSQSAVARNTSSIHIL